MTRGISLLKVMAAQLLALLLCCPALALAQAPDFIEFESGQVRPLAMSADGSRLFAVNTPNNALEIFSITASGLTLTARVPVGLEPVAVAVRDASEVWVVNHLSDSVSVVSLSGTPHVSRTILASRNWRTAQPHTAIAAIARSEPVMPRIAALTAYQSGGWYRTW